MEQQRVELRRAIFCRSSRRVTRSTTSGASAARRGDRGRVRRLQARLAERRLDDGRAPAPLRRRAPRDAKRAPAGRGRITLPAASRSPITRSNTPSPARRERRARAPLRAAAPRRAAPRGGDRRASAAPAGASASSTAGDDQQCCRRATRSAGGRQPREQRVRRRPGCHAGAASRACATGRPARASLGHHRLDRAVSGDRRAAGPSAGPTGSSRSKRRRAAVGPDGAAGRMRVEHDAAGDGDGRRVGAQDEPVAARQRPPATRAGAARTPARRPAPPRPRARGVSWSSPAPGGARGWRRAPRARAPRSSPGGSARARRASAAARTPAPPAARRACASARACPASRANLRGRSSSSSTPPRFTATRCPATAPVSVSPCTCRPRTFTPRPAGSSASSSSGAHAPGHERAGHDGAEPLHREHAIDRQPREPAGAARRHARGELHERRPEGVEPLAGLRRRPPRSARPSRNDPATSSRASSRASSSISSSTRSVFVSTTRPCGHAAAAGRSRSARASAASPTRRRRRPAPPRRCRRRRRACS